MKVALRTVGIGSALVLAAAAGAGALFVYLGGYDISATEQHTRPVFKLMDYAMRRSVQARARDIAVPDLQQPQRIRRGAALYRAHCLQCHGAPGVAPEPFASGLLPAPANLVGTARAWRDAELFWVIRHGIKMTGMPAWLQRLRDEEIWDLVAFVRASVMMAPQEYEALAAALPAGERIPRSEPAVAAASRSPGDPEAGRRAAAQLLCGTCHVIPGLVGADRHVGPPLSGIARRATIGGVVSNTPENMVRWLKDPRALDPLSAMPALGLSDRQARDIAAFLYTLEDVEAK